MSDGWHFPYIDEDPHPRRQSTDWPKLAASTFGAGFSLACWTLAVLLIIWAKGLV
jgi:hypothetical protein